MRLKGGPTVKAIATPDLQSGDSCLLSIRPERVSVGATASDENQLHGIIEGSIYLGDHLRLLLRTGELLIIAKVPNKNTMRLGIQEDTLFGWSAVDCRAFALSPGLPETTWPRHRTAAPLADEPGWLQAAPFTNW